MKTNKLLLSSLILAGLVSACTNEEIVNVAQNDATLENRTQVNLTISSPAESRMAATGEDKMGTSFTANDLLGAVLVDAGYTSESNAKDNKWNNVNWNVVGGHVGNNKWLCENGKFYTEGTTAVGAWLFYTKYNEEMTTTRDGVKFSFPQIQEGAKDYTYIENNNINFKLTPVLAIDGYEGQDIDLDVRYISVFNQLRMAFDFSDVKAEEVQKIIVSAKDATGAQISFPAQYKVVNTNLKVADLSLDAESPVYVDDVNDDDIVNLADQNLEIQNSIAEMAQVSVNWEEAIDFKNLVENCGETTYPYLVVDCEKGHGTSLDAESGTMEIAEDGKFSAIMLMPSGVYGSITFDIYTDKGVFTKTVDNRVAYRANMTDAEKAADKIQDDRGKNAIFLRPNFLTNICDVENRIPNADGTTKNIDKKEYIKIAEDDVKTDAQDIITKTTDFINFINGIQKAGSYNLEVITQAQVGGDDEADDPAFDEHAAVIINKAVMDAIDAKKEEVGNFQLVITSTAPVKVYGETQEAPLAIHDLTFNNSCQLVSGYIDVKDEDGVPTELIIPDGQKMLVKSGVNLVLDNYGQDEEDTFDCIDIAAGANVTVKSDLWINKVNNKGSIIVEEELSVTEELKNIKYATITNNGTFEIADLAVANNNGTITNKASFNVNGNVDNNNVIENKKGALIYVNNEAVLENKIAAVITNEGEMYCNSNNIANKINNVGTINAKTGSTTYITTNSSDVESEKGTNSLNMGTIVLDNRNEEISVTDGNRQGYIQYAVPSNVSELEYVVNDKFNKVILNADTELCGDMETSKVKYIVVNSPINLNLPADAKIQEIDFNANTVLYSVPTDEEDQMNGAYMAEFNVAKGVTVKVPTENAISIKQVETNLKSGEKEFKSMTYADIKNNGTILVGGNLYSSLNESITTNNGTFASGDGLNTAFHWGKTSSSTSGYQKIGDEAKVQTPEGLINALQAGEKNISLSAGEYEFPKSVAEGVTINCAEGTVFEGASTLNIPGATVVGAKFSNPLGNATTSTISGTFKDCTFEGKNAMRWSYASGELVFENCTFDGKGVYAIHYDGLTGANVLYKDCTIIGWTAISSGAASLTFDGCEIYGNGTYGLIRTYGDATIKNCTFDVSKVNKTDVFQDGIHAVDCTIIVENCVNVNGNIEDIFNVSGTGKILNY